MLDDSLCLLVGLLFAEWCRTEDSGGSHHQQA